MSPVKRPSETAIGRGLRTGAAAAGPAEATGPAVAADPALRQPAASSPRRNHAARSARQAPIRFTLDLAPELHGFLKDFAQGADVIAADVMRELLRQLRADPELGRRVETEIWRRREALQEAQRQAQQ